jgi:hypothetical protein
MTRPGETKTGEIQHLQTTNTLMDAILFDFDIDSFQLKDAHQNFLNDVIAFVKQGATGPLTVSIDGFASRTGTAKHNLILSENREEAVEGYLRTHTDIFDTPSPHKVNRRFHGFTDSPAGENARFRSVRVVVHIGDVPPPPVPPLPKEEGSKDFELRLIEAKSATIFPIGGVIHQKARFLFVDLKRQRQQEFLYEGTGNSLSTPSKGLSITFGGPFAAFHTLRGAAFSDFKGSASLGSFVSVGPASMKSKLTIESPPFFSGANRILETDINFATGATLGGSISLFSATKGNLEPKGPEKNF